MKSMDRFRGEDLESNKRRAFAFHVLCATIIFLSAAALRVWQLGPSSLWFDDAWVALVARMSAGQLTQVGMTSFGFQVILWIWLHLVGFSEVGAQLIPFLAGYLGPVLKGDNITRTKRREVMPATKCTPSTTTLWAT
jgi:hypothetical protein